MDDDVVMTLIEKRIKQTDCTLNGWVLDEYPNTVGQISHLKSLRLKPSLVIMFECPEDVCKKRIHN